MWSVLWSFHAHVDRRVLTSVWPRPTVNVHAANRWHGVVKSVGIALEVCGYFGYRKAIFGCRQQITYRVVSGLHFLPLKAVPVLLA